MPRNHAVVLASAFVGAAGACAGTIVQVDVMGVVDFNVIQGNQAGIPSGSPVMMSFQVSSSHFVNSPNFPTRGYEVDLTSFTLTVGGAPITIDNPQPFGPAYFVIRNNDPVVDGFFLSRNIDFPMPVGVHIPGLAPAHDLDFGVTYNSGATIPSLDILDAVGTYDLTGLSVYNWTVGRFGNAGAEYAFQRMTISVIPAPAGAGVVAMAGLMGLRRRRG